MRIPINDILMIYESIIGDINVAEVSMILFTALDVDSVCTLKIITSFLKNQNVLYEFYPVSSYTELEQKIEDCKSYEKIKLFFFINCGGLIDLTSKWFSKTATVFLFDVNKPIHHANVDAGNIKIVDDELSELQRAPTVKQVEIFQNLDDQLIEDMQDRELEPDQDDDIDVIARKRRRHRASQQAMQKMEKLRKIKTEISLKVQKYYSQQFFGLPSSYIAYKMIKDLNKSNNNYLWYAIVGITGMYIEQKLQKEQFDKLSQLIQTDLLRFNKQEEKPQKSSLNKKLDFLFPLFRHWTLYDSILNSGYMIGGLGLWDVNGVSKLNELISLIGLSLNQSKQLYKYMMKKSVQKIESELIANAQKQRFNLLNIAFDSFSRQVDYAFEMTASDYYYILATVLEKPTKKTNIAQVMEHRIQCFLESYNLFSCTQSKLLPLIEQAKRVLAIYAKQAKSLVQRNHIMNGEGFSFVNILNDTEDRRIFEHPNSLTKFAYMLMFLTKKKKKFNFNKPFIASLQNNVTQTAQIVGIMSDSKNQFSLKFNRVIEKLQIEVRMDSFMNTIMTVPKQSLVKIIKELGQL